MTRLSNHWLSRGRPLLVVLAAGRASSILPGLLWGCSFLTAAGMARGGVMGSGWLAAGWRGSRTG